MNAKEPAQRCYENLRVYQHADALASDLFWITRRFPMEEHDVLTAQLRRTARTIPLSVLQGWKERYCGQVFRIHLDEAQSAAARLGLWLDFAFQREYLRPEEYQQLLDRRSNVQRLLTRLYEKRIALLA